MGFVNENANYLKAHASSSVEHRFTSLQFLFGSDDSKPPTENKNGQVGRFQRALQAASNGDLDARKEDNMADLTSCKDIPVQNLEENKTCHLSICETRLESQDESSRCLIDVFPEPAREDKFFEVMGGVHGNGNVNWFHALIEKVSRWLVERRGSELERYRDQDGHPYDSWL